MEMRALASDSCCSMYTKRGIKRPSSIPWHTGLFCAMAATISAERQRSSDDEDRSPMWIGNFTAVHVCMYVTELQTLDKDMCAANKEEVSTEVDILNKFEQLVQSLALSLGISRVIHGCFENGLQ